MSVLRIILAFLIVFFCYLMGRLKTERYNKQLTLYSDIISDLKHSERLIMLERKPMGEIMEILSKTGAASDLWTKLISGNDIPQSGAASAMFFRGELLDSLVNGCLSDSSLEAERIGEIISALEKDYYTERDKVRSRSKLIGALSILLGISVALLII